MNGPIGSGSFSNIAKESLQQYFHSQFVKAIDQRSQMGSETAPTTSNGVPKCKNYCHYYKGSFKNYVDKMRWVGGQKMLLFVHVPGIKCPR